MSVTVVLKKCFKLCMMLKNWKGTCGRHCNIKSNERGLRLLEFASYNDLMVANTFGSHKNPEKSRDTVQMGKPTIRLITSWLGNDSVQV